MRRRSPRMRTPRLPVAVFLPAPGAPRSPVFSRYSGTSQCCRCSACQHASLPNRAKRRKNAKTGPRALSARRVRSCRKHSATIPALRDARPEMSARLQKKEARGRGVAKQTGSLRPASPAPFIKGLLVFTRSHSQPRLSTCEAITDIMRPFHTARRGGCPPDPRGRSSLLRAEQRLARGPKVAPLPGSRFLETGREEGAQNFEPDLLVQRANAVLLQMRVDG